MRTAVLAAALVFPQVLFGQANPREALRVADERAGATAFTSGFAKALFDNASDDVVLLFDGAPI